MWSASGQRGVLTLQKMISVLKEGKGSGVCVWLHFFWKVFHRMTYFLFSEYNLFVECVRSGVAIRVTLQIKEKNELTGLSICLFFSTGIRGLLKMWDFIAVFQLLVKPPSPVKTLPCVCKPLSISLLLWLECYYMKVLFDDERAEVIHFKWQSVWILDLNGIILEWLAKEFTPQRVNDPRCSDRPESKSILSLFPSHRLYTRYKLTLLWYT